MVVVKRKIDVYLIWGQDRTEQGERVFFVEEQGEKPMKEIKRMSMNDYDVCSLRFLIIEFYNITCRWNLLLFVWLSDEIWFLLRRS